MSKTKVLVVDDTDHARSMLVDMLELDGFEVAGQAASGPQAIDIAPKVVPDVVVMDQDAGYERSHRGQEDPRPPPVQAIILYTAYLDSRLEQQAKDAGIALCIGKVEGLSRLERHITELVRDFSS